MPIGILIYDGHRPSLKRSSIHDEKPSWFSMLAPRSAIGVIALGDLILGFPLKRFSCFLVDFGFVVFGG
jgi:hypothetical protein